MSKDNRTIFARECELTSPLEPPLEKEFSPQTFLLEEISLMEDFRKSDQALQLVDKFESKSANLFERIKIGRELAIKGDPRIFVKSISNMVPVPGGDVEIGINENEIDHVLNEYGEFGVIREWILKETPRHTERIKSFNISRYPVTNLEYLYFLLENKNADIPTCWVNRAFPVHLSNHPVYTISAKSADWYCRWISGKNNTLARLPSEAEWEYAAGASKYKYPWGDWHVVENANSMELGLLETTPIGCFKEGKSPFGLYDMAGNVEEYTADNYDAYPGGKFVVDDLISPTRLTYRVTKGGCFGRFADLCRVTRRHGLSITPFSSIYAVGFRIVTDF